MQPALSPPGRRVRPLLERDGLLQQTVQSPGTGLRPKRPACLPHTCVTRLFGTGLVLADGLAVSGDSGAGGCGADGGGLSVIETYPSKLARSPLA